MRYGILSDVHGNLEALEVVLEELERLRVDRYAFLGDAVGYGASPNEVCDLLRARGGVAVLGNHDAAVAGRMDYVDYYEAARRALDWCARRLTPENMAWLRGLPYTAAEGEVGFCHGAPFVPEDFDYLFAADQLAGFEDELERLPAMSFIGHSHLCVSFRIASGAATQVVAHEIECRAGERYIVTAGSVGQPRDRDPRACFGVYDTEARVFTHHRLEYDVHAARQKILDAGLPSVFGDRLLVGV